MKPGLLATILLVVLVVPGCGGGDGELLVQEPVTVTETVAVTTAITTEVTTEVTTGVAPPSAPATGAEPAGPSDEGDLILQYIPPETEALLPAFEALRRSEVLDDVVAAMNETVALPTDVLVSVEELGQPNAFYVPGLQAVVIGPEFVDYAYALFAEAGVTTDPEELEAAAIAVTAFVFLHELGHALVHVLDLPVTGREEDAVDQLATIVVTDEAADAGEVALVAAELFGLQASYREVFEASDFWDEHSLDEQRFFGIFCWVYGSDPQQYLEYVAELGIEQERLDRCEVEYQEIVDAWETLLGPYVKA